MSISTVPKIMYTCRALYFTIKQIEHYLSQIDTQFRVVVAGRRLAGCEFE